MQYFCELSKEKQAKEHTHTTRLHTNNTRNVSQITPHFITINYHNDYTIIIIIKIIIFRLTHTHCCEQMQREKNNGRDKSKCPSLSFSV